MQRQANRKTSSGAQLAGENLMYYVSKVHIKFQKKTCFTKDFTLSQERLEKG